MQEAPGGAVFQFQAYLCCLLLRHLTLPPTDSNNST